jgi:hypothetical protein
MIPMPLCGYAPHLTALVAIFLTQAITFIVPVILKQHGVIPSNETMSTFLYIY